MRQRDVIGEWVPDETPEQPGIVFAGMRWADGLTFEQIRSSSSRAEGAHHTADKRSPVKGPSPSSGAGDEIGQERALHHRVERDLCGLLNDAET